MTTDTIDKLKSLTRLMVARQVQLTEQDFQVYLEELVTVPPVVVDRACRTLAVLPRAEFESAFPSLGTILQTCRRVQMPDPAQNTRLMLDAARANEMPEMTPEEAKTFWADMRRRYQEQLAAQKVKRDE